MKKLKFIPFVLLFFLNSCVLMTKKEYQEILTERQTINERFNLLKMEKRFLEDKIQSLQKEKTILSQEMSSLRENTAKKMGSLESNVHSLRTNYKLLLEEEKKKVNDLEALHDLKDKKILLLQQDNQGLSAANQVQRKRYSVLEKKLKALSAQNKRRGERILKLEREKERDKQEKIKREKELGGLVKKLKMLTGKEAKEVNKAKAIQEELKTEFAPEIKEQKISAIRIESELYLQIFAELLFDPERQKVKMNGEKILTRLGNILAQLKNRQIIVEGYFGDEDMGDQSWGESLMRAIEVIKFFRERTKINPDNLLALGYSFSPPSADSQSQNHRIEILVLPWKR